MPRRSSSTGSVASTSTRAARRPIEPARTSRGRRRRRRPASGSSRECARVLVPAAIVALEVSTSQPSSTNISGLGLASALGYVMATALVTLIFLAGNRGKHGRNRGPWENQISALARANSLLAISVLPLLPLVSASSTVLVSSPHRLVDYDWLPVWLAVVGTLGCLIAWVWVVGRPHDAVRDSVYEARVLTWLVGPVAVFVLTAGIAGALGRFIGYDDALFQAAPQLIFHHGLFPWRDIYMIHGLLNDGLDGAVGMAVFGNSRWGVTTGFDLIVNPLTMIGLDGFAAYFCRKNRLVLVGLVVVMGTGLLEVGLGLVCTAAVGSRSV